MTQQPGRDQVAAAVLGICTVLALTGLDTIATVWPDSEVVTDTDLNALADRWAIRHPWM